MNLQPNQNSDRKMTSPFERFLSVWVLLCIIAGILLGKIAPGLARYMDSLAIDSHCHMSVLHDVSHHGEDRLW